MHASRLVGVVIAVGSLAALPACSWMQRETGMGTHQSGTSAGQSSGMGDSGAMAQSQLSPDLVRRVQTGLQQSGDYKGKIDGLWGADTRDALRRYQQAHNMTATGELDERTLHALNISGGANASTAAGSNQPTPGGNNPAAIGAPPPPSPPSSNSGQ